MKFDYPTVKDVSDYLQSLTPETPFRVVDPDTGWAIYVFEINVTKNGTAELTAESGDIDDDTVLDLMTCIGANLDEISERITFGAIQRMPYESDYQFRKRIIARINSVPKAK